MTENEMQALFDKMRAGIDLTNEEMIALARNTGYMSGQFKRLEVGVDAFAKNIKKAGDELPKALLKSAGDTVKSLGGVAKSLGEAETGFRALTPIIDAAAAAFSTVPFFGGAVKAAAEASKFMINQLQNATDAFHDIAKVGGLTASGMTGLQQQFLESGMQLKSYTKTIAANSAALSNFAGSVGEGAEKFSKTAGMVQKQFGQGLQRLGYGIDEIGETTASYIARQTRMGLSQGKSNEMLAAGAARYAVELDELSKLTGASKDELKKQQDAALSESRFRGKIEEMRMNGQGEQAEKLIAAQAALAKQSPALGRAFRDSVSGFIGTSKESIAGYQSLGGEMAGLVDTAMTGSISDVTNFSKDAMKRMMPMFAQLAQMGVDIGIPFSEMADAANGVTKSSKDLKTVQDKQITDPDKLTKETISAQRNMQELSIGMQKLGFTYMADAAKAVNTFTNSLNKLLKLVSDETGGPAVTIASPDGTTAASTTGPGVTAVEQQAGQARAKKAAARQSAYDARFQGETNEQRRQREYDERQAAPAAVPAGAAPAAPDAPAAVPARAAPAAVPARAAPAAPGETNEQRRQREYDERQAAPAAVPVTPVARAALDRAALDSPDLGAGPAFSRPDNARADKIQLTLEEIREEIKKLVAVGGISTGATGGQQAAQAALAEYDHAPQVPMAAGFGSVAEKYETGGRGSGTIGYDTTGGTSYGKYQIASKPGTMDSYIKHLAQTNPEAAAQLQAAGPSNTGSTSGKFADTWKKLSQSGALGSTESSFIKKSHYDPAMAGIKNKGLQDMIGGDKGLQEMLFSTSTQHGAGGASGIMNKVYKQGMTKEDLVKATYAERGTQFGSSTPEVQKSVQNRFVREKQDILALMGQPGGVLGAGAPTAEAVTAQGFNMPKGAARSAGTSSTLATPTAPVAAPSYASATAGLAGQGQDIISSGLQAVTTALFGGSSPGAASGADSGVGNSEVVTLLSQLVALSRDQNSNLGKILSASTA